MSNDEVFNMFKEGNFPPRDLEIYSIHGELLSREQMKFFDNNKFALAHIKDCNNLVKKLQVVNINSEDIKARERLDSLFSNNIDLHIKLIKFRIIDTSLANKIIKEIIANQKFKEISRTSVVLDTSISCKNILSLLNSAFKRDQFNRETENINIFEDQKNFNILESIRVKCGWKAIEDAGEESVYPAFMIVQHSSPQNRKTYFPFFESSMNKGLLKRSTLALMIDRILCDNNKKQIYGTQFLINNKTGEKKFLPIENLQKIDSIRNTVGLGSLSEYLKIINNKE
ncbi:MAG: hypothetical protein IPJ13_21875 [Saprospiraceae bacterium]|nr:hypothetical protein [Saprospiraceae bacterium]